ncbi:M12 family metallo-peptidase [Nocardioides sp.]|uniref:M12 family metallo-peptidase n=1 Tax=Nocardioides sp. TaxID=35761 RepID=UPI0031FE907E|nr:hypothetical protein [Nocardioides sp.]
MSRLVRPLAALFALLLAAAALSASTSTSATATAKAGDSADEPMYQSAPGFRPTANRARVAPNKYSAVLVNVAKVRAALPAAGAGRTTFPVPTPAGGTERFSVRRTSVMEPKLAAAHPEIATWAGRSLEHPGTTIALDVTPLGFHASVRGPSGQGAWYVDPAYDERGTTVHLSYSGGQVPRAEDTFVERETPTIRKDLTRSAGQHTARRAAGSLVKQRVYRLALTSDPSYAAYFGSANVTAAKVTLINRVNQIYNDDMAIKMILVANNDALNFDTEAKATGANGPCGAHPCFDPPIDNPGTNNDVPGQLDFCDIGTLGRNRTVLGLLIGADNYDIGHIALGVNGGGIAELGVVGADYKGGGCTGIPQPKGDFFAIDYVAHEMGHQFDGNHTFNGINFACSGGNRNGSTSVEPGSGSSVMAYAGICGQDDLQPHTDPYFSQRSITEVSGYTSKTAKHVADVQDVSLEGFDSNGDTITIAFGAETPVTLTRGTDYDAAHIKSAVEAMTGQQVIIAGWGYDPWGSYDAYPAPLTEPDDTGFQVIFSNRLLPERAPADSVDVADLSVTGSSGVTTMVGETAKGGPADNRGDVVTTTANHAPVAHAPANKTLPTRTPFTLTGSGSDSDGNHLTYLWEQNDKGGASGTNLVSNKKVTGPLFRIFGVYAAVTSQGTLHSPSPGENLATGSPSRTFPDLKQVLAGTTNARTGKCPKAPGNPNTALPRYVLNCYSEFLPTADYLGTPGSTKRAMHFRITARDGFANGGGTGHDDVVLRVDPNAGPFLVTSQAEKGLKVAGGTMQRVTWDVNGTRPLAHNVRIRLSTDGGKTFDRVLKGKTPNDGSVTVKLPKVSTGAARIMVEARGNYFFAVNPKGFSIKGGGSARPLRSRNLF